MGAAGAIAAAVLPQSAGGRVSDEEKAMIARIFIWLIRVYQSTARWRPPVCRFTPSCSQYAVEALQKHGVVRGSAMALWRICRCSPLCRGGYDPVR